MLKVKTVCGGYDRNFSYLLYDEKSKEAGIIDTSVELKIIFEFVSNLKLKVKFAVIMHSHFDHMVNLDHYKEQGIKLIAAETCKEDVNQKVKDKDILTLGENQLKIMVTPGHLHDSICVLTDHKLFTSDTLFINGCGRVDLEGANTKDMKKSLKRIKQLPDNTLIYPGHDYGNKPTSTLGEQKITNLHLQQNKI